VPGAAYKKGDVIGQKYEVYGVLGAGGCGIVYLVYSHETQGIYALKTFLDRYLADAQARERFRKEASVWVELERHPHLVRAHFVEEITGRLFIATEHVARDEHGLNTLEDYLRQRPPDLAQSLRWAIQLCHGMEYAYSRGIRCHRDIKPANIMIGSDKAVKITDFGLAGALGIAGAVSGIRLNVQQGTVGLSGQTMEGTGFGTPTHMPPEQFTDAATCDERSDIYAFGVVLFQMASGGRLPFNPPLPRDDSEAEKARYYREMHRLHATAPVPKQDSPLFHIIQRCLEKEPDKRYQSFKELREDLEPLLRRQTGETIRLPELNALAAWEWCNKGLSLHSLGRYEAAIRCFDKALELDPRCAAAWDNKGNCLSSLGRYEEAIRCYDKALELDPQKALAWDNKGNCLSSLGRHEEAIRCHEKALELDPMDAAAWNNKGDCLDSLGRHDEALRCYDEALELVPQLAAAWNNKGTSLGALGHREEAIRCFDKALALHPRFVPAWSNRGHSLHLLGRYEEAVRCHDEVLELDPRSAAVWTNKGNSLRNLGRTEEAIRCYDKALELDPRLTAALVDKGLGLDSIGRYEEAIRCHDKALGLDPLLGVAWNNDGNSHYNLGRYDDAIRCYDKAIELDPRDAVPWYGKAGSFVSLSRYEDAIRCYHMALELDPRYAAAWYGKGLAQEKLGRKVDALRSYKQFIALAPAQYAEQVAYAQRRVRELEGR
jgi:tetratricopeptide (TPR) repeat protein